MEKKYIEFKLYKGKVLGKFFPDSHRYYVGEKRPPSVTGILGIIDKSRPLVIWATELMRDFLLEIESKGIGKIGADHIYKASTLHEEKKKEAADIGTEIHDWVERFVKGENPDMPESKEAQIGVTSFLQWTEENKVKFISSERVVYSKKHDYIGKMDIEAKVNGKLCLIDIKSSNGLYNTYNLQTAAYVKADEEESDRKYQGRWLIRVAKETEKEYWTRMKKKNDARVAKGKEPVEYPAYQVFEAKFLDDEETNIERDFKAFLSAKNLFEWNKATDYFTNK
jgi:hypothetical protein